MPVTQARVEAISRVPLFSGCSEEDLQDIAAIAAETAFAPGQVLCEQGDDGGEFFVLLDGHVDVSRDGLWIDALRAGDFFGEIALITRAPRNATVMASEASHALVIQADDFRELLERSPGVFVKVFVRLAERVPPQDI